MEEMIKLIWDFRGNDADLTSQHHAKHLITYALKNGIEENAVRSKKISDDYSIATIVVPRSKMIDVRDSLRPHRGEVA